MRTMTIIYLMMMVRMIMMMKRLFVKNLIINNFFELVQSGLPFPEARSIYETTPELLVFMGLYDGHAF